MADVLAGAIGMAGDSVAALIGRGIGGPVGSPSAAVMSALAGAATNAFVDQVTGLLPPDAQGPAKILIAGAFALGLGKPPAEVLGATTGPAMSFLTGAAGNEVRGSEKTHFRDLPPEGGGAS